MSAIADTYRPRARRRGAFTLVELLVVIGIIALLVSILLPSLNRAREAAKRANCLSNLRGIGQFCVMYVNQNKGFLPIGYSADVDSANPTSNVWYSVNYYILRWNGSVGTERYVGLGLLIPGGQISSNGEEGQIFYCPSTNDDTVHAMRSPQGPNPYVDDFLFGNVPASTNGKGVRISYGARASDPTSDLPPNQRGIMWRYLPTSPHYPVNGRTDGTMKVGMMRQARMKTRAILTDVAANTRVRVAHVKGINVLSADGSARYVDGGYLGDHPQFPGTPFLLAMTVNTGNTTNDTMDIFWQRLDDAP